MPIERDEKTKGFAYLPAFEVASKVGKGGREPVIDTVQGQLLVGHFHDRLKSRHGVRGGRRSAELS